MRQNPTRKKLQQICLEHWQKYNAEGDGFYRALMEKQEKAQKITWLHDSQTMLTVNSVYYRLDRVGDVQALLLIMSDEQLFLLLEEQHCIRFR